MPRRGGRFKAAAPFQPFAVVSGGGRLITGQQNFSGQLVGRNLVEALKGDEVRRLAGIWEHGPCVVHPEPGAGALEQAGG